MPEPIPPPPPQSAEEELERAQRLAVRYRCEFVDLSRQHIDPSLFRLIPVELMFRHHFIPVEASDGNLIVAIADPSQFFVVDELSVRLGRNVIVKVATQEQIDDILKKSEQSQRVLEEVTEGFRLDVVRETEDEDGTISVEKLTRDTEGSPVIRLVDSTLFNALERRASDIHIETSDNEVVVKYRIDGVLLHAMPPLAKEWHAAIISRIKVMSELDIAERRIPQDGRFRVRYKTRPIDVRVSIMPSIHGEDAVLRILDKESLSERFR
ncbi:MAG TPA: ATPase, T2SS/T4P/T4SS family, partial [Candidatus Acidoferrales bacterium]